MRISEEGLALVKRFEGFSAVPYDDAAGLPTIGYGHLIKDGEAFGRISQGEAEVLLKRDIAVAEKAVAKFIHVDLSQQQFDALVSFTFNLGAGALQRSTLRIKLNRGEFDEIPSEFLRWVWAGGRKSAGLLRRREAESRLFAAMPRAMRLTHG